MKISTAILLAGASTVGVGVARLVQGGLHQRQQNDVAVTGLQDRWVTLLTTHPDLAASWKPSDMTVEEYVKVLNANQQLCSLSLRYRLGLITKDRLRFYATYLMNTEVVRRYWEKFGPLREEEALGDKRATDFQEAMGDAYDALIRRVKHAAGA